MILKASQRGGPRQLAAHLLNAKDNDHVTVAELRGFVSEDLYGAMAETVAVSKGTRCRQPVFSLSMNPPKDAAVTPDEFIQAADRAGEALGLDKQPRAIVIHEKDGRMHAHVVWSRIDPEAMKAVNLPHFKNKLRALSKELFLEHGWELPEGHKTNGHRSPLNFTLAEWQQAQRLDLDPRELKQIFQSAWERSDNLLSFKHALSEQGYFLAQGDRRGVVALDINGEVFSVSRALGVKSKEIAKKLQGFESLPGVEATRETVRAELGKKLKSEFAKDLAAKKHETKPLLEARRKLVSEQRREREVFEKKRHDRWCAETKSRSQKFRRGLGAVMDVLTGRWFAIRKENKAEAKTSDERDKKQRLHLVSAQMKQRKALQKRIDELKKTQRADRMRTARQIVQIAAYARAGRDARRHEQERGMERERTPGGPA